MKDDFISIADHSTEWINGVFELSADMKNKLNNGETYHPLKGKTLAMVFQKPSARTRISFEIGMFQLGGHALYLSPNDIQMGKRESTKDLARLFSRYNDVVMARLFGHHDILQLAEYASIPIINGLTDLLHPCQIMADLFTVKEHFGRVSDLKIVFVGDGNNVANSWINMAGKFPFNFVLACPEGYDPDEVILENARNQGVGSIEVNYDPFDAVKDADVIYTDVWASMGQEEEQAKRDKDFKDFQVNSKLVSNAKPDYKFMHCLPAHRGAEVTDAVIDSPNSIVFDEAENRLHVQKGIMAKLMV
ncbi:ornithine carbamoyltransferase [candidate division KSB1 bacterium]